MKALVYRGPKQIEYCDVPEPSRNDEEVLVAVHSVGICGSDMHAYLGHDERRPAPLILGHEVAGVIADGPEAGKRVTVNPLVTCGQCQACTTGRENLCPNRQIISMQPREGGFAEFITIPRENLVEVPDHVSHDIAAMAEPLAVSWHAARLALEALYKGEEREVQIIGGGAIGLAAALAFKAMGCNEVAIMETNEKRRDFLNAQCGVQAFSDLGDQTAIVVDAVGYAATREKGSQLVSPGGVFVHIGLGEDTGGLDIRRITLQEIQFIGTYTYTKQDFVDTAQAIFDGSLGALDWADRRPLEAGSQAFTDILSGAVPHPKIILNPSHV